MRKPTFIVTVFCFSFLSLAGGGSAPLSFCLPETPFADEQPKSPQAIRLRSTYYLPVPGQTDSRPLETATGDIIDLAKLAKKKIKWVAVSRDLLATGLVSLNDTIQIVSSVKEMDGYFVIKDKTGKYRTSRRGKQSISKTLDFLLSKKPDVMPDSVTILIY